MKNVCTVLLVLFIILLFACREALSIENNTAKSGQLPVSSRAKDRGAMEKQRKQQKQAAEQNASSLGSAGSDVSSAEKKKREFTGRKTNGQPTTGLPTARD